MLGIKLFACGLSLHRKFSTNSTGKSINLFNSYRAKGAKNTRIEWSEEQKELIFAVSEGKSVFITGSAGTGKTILLKHIIKLLKRCNRPSKVFVTAPTGVAACSLGGQTLHSFSGVGYPMADRNTLLRRVVMNKRACKRWLKAEALVIDEISMVDAELFDSLEYIARNVRQRREKWGGIQVVVGGDFFQLPPVKPQQNSEGNEFAFEADCWDFTFDKQVYLTKVFRQSDPQLIKLLQGIRRGEMDAEDIKFLEQACLKAEPDPSVVRLYPRIEDVNRVNSSRLESLGNELVVYTAVDSGEDSSKKQLDQGIAPKEIALCKGARVMLVKNLNTWRGLVNGATGTVTRFYEPEDEDVTSICDDGLLPVVRFNSGLEMVIKPEIWAVTEGDTIVAKREQVPLILAWALSIHKCQGKTLDCLHTDLSRAFENGMVYVALSRVRSLEGLYLSGFDRSKIMVHPKVVQFYERLRQQDMENEDDNVSQKEDSSNDDGSCKSDGSTDNASQNKDCSNDNVRQKKYGRNNNGNRKIEGDGSAFRLVYMK